MSILEKQCKENNSKLSTISDIGFSYIKNNETYFMLYKDFVEEILYDTNEA